MPTYKAPLRDMRFLINEVLDYPAHYTALANGGEATPDMVDAILEGAATLCEEVLAPINLSGDQEGCHFEAGEVTTPAGFKEAYRQFVDGGWQGLSFPTEYGGQGLPTSLSLFKTEMMGAANWSFNMYPGLSLGCINNARGAGGARRHCGKHEHRAGWRRAGSVRPGRNGGHSLRRQGEGLFPREAGSGFGTVTGAFERCCAGGAQRSDAVDCGLFPQPAGLRAARGRKLPGSGGTMAAAVGPGRTGQGRGDPFTFLRE